MKVLVCGGRDYKHDKHVNEVLSKIDISCIISGGAAGADRLGENYAKANGLELKVYKAEWNFHGPAAGPIRNARMLSENPDIELVIAFKGGPGTNNMKSQARAKGLQILEA